MKRKGLSFNLRIMMVLVIIVITVLLLFQTSDNNLLFVSDFGNKSINGSVSGVIE